MGILGSSTGEKRMGTGYRTLDITTRIRLPITEQGNYKKQKKPTAKG